MTPAATQRRPDRDRFAAGGTNHMTDFDYGLAGRRTAWQSRRRRLLSPIPSSFRGFDLNRSLAFDGCRGPK
jgi:hypothetical protein